MRCLLSGTNAKVLAKAIHSFARIGYELFLDATEDGLSIRTVSQAKSAFALIKFSPDFFEEYDVDTDGDDEFENKCKISVKATIGIFKSMKQVELCSILLDSSKSKLIVQFKCRLETVKTHYLSILDIESLQAAYMTENSPNMICAPFKVFQEISSNFQMNEDEITFEANEDSLTVKNYVEGSHVDRRFMRSQLTLKPQEFDKYLIRLETSLTFCLKEFRAFLNFAEAVNLDLNVNFEKAGRPVVFVVKSQQSFEANLVMSTLEPEDVSMYQNTSIAKENANVSKNSTAKRATRVIEEDETRNSKRKRITSNTDTGTLLGDDDDELFNFENPKEHLESIDAVRMNRNDDGPAGTDSGNALLTSNVYDKEISSLPLATVRETRRSSLARHKTQNTDSEGICVTFRDTEPRTEPDDDQIPKSPEIERKKKARLIFRRCFEDTYNVREAPGSSQVLARNSDTED